MTTTEIKKEMQNTLKANGWNKCYGAYGINLSAGAKQLEKRNAPIGFGFIECKDYNAEEAFQKFTTSKEFTEMLKKIGGTYEREEKKDGSWTILYIRIHF